MLSREHTSQIHYGTNGQKNVRLFPLNTVYIHIYSIRICIASFAFYNRIGWKRTRIATAVNHLPLNIHDLYTKLKKKTPPQSRNVRSRKICHSMWYRLFTVQHMTKVNQNYKTTKSFDWNTFHSIYLFFFGLLSVEISIASIIWLNA